MDFMEAVKNMKEGNILGLGDTLYKYNPEATCKDREFYIKYKLTDWIPLKGFSMSEIESTTWQVVDEDENWSLAQTNQYVPSTYSFQDYMDKSIVNTYGFYTGDDVKKCRNLIIRDLSEIGSSHFGKITNTNPEINAYFNLAKQIINKRFGDI